MSEYNLINYKLINSVSFDNLSNKEQKIINLAFNESQKSDFTNSYKTGAYKFFQRVCMLRLILEK